MLPHFTSRHIKAALTQPIIIKWLAEFETLVGTPGQLYPVFEEAIPVVQLEDFCRRIRTTLGLSTSPQAAIAIPAAATIARVQAFAWILAHFPELKRYPATITPFRDYAATDDEHYRATVLLRSLDIISSVYRSRDIDPMRALNYFEAAKILARIAHLMQGKPVHKHLFLAHASADKDVVRNMRAALQARGFICTYDEACLALGAALRAEIRRQLALPNMHLLLFWSQAAAQSEWVRFELDTMLEMASGRGKIFALCLDRTPMPSTTEMRYSDFLYCRSIREYERMCDLEKNCEEVYFAMLNQ